MGNIVFRAAAALGALLCLPALAIAGDEWVANSANAPVLIPPFSRQVFAGEVFRVVPVQNQAFRLMFDGGERGGVVIAMPERELKAFAGKEVLQSKKPLVFKYSKDEIGSVALRVFTGAGTLSAEIDPMEEKILSEGEKAEFRMTPGKEAFARFVNVSDFRTIFTYEFFSGETSMSKDPARVRTLTLDFKGNDKEKTWDCEGDKMTVTVYKGKVLVKAGQPFLAPAAGAAGAAKN